MLGGAAVLLVLLGLLFIVTLTLPRTINRNALMGPTKTRIQQRTFNTMVHRGFTSNKRKPKTGFNHRTIGGTKVTETLPRNINSKALARYKRTKNFPRYVNTRVLRSLSRSRMHSGNINAMAPMGLKKRAGTSSNTMGPNLPEPITTESVHDFTHIMIPKDLTSSKILNDQTVNKDLTSSKILNDHTVNKDLQRLLGIQTPKVQIKTDVTSKDLSNKRTPRSGLASINNLLYLGNTKTSKGLIRNKTPKLFTSTRILTMTPLTTLSTPTVLPEHENPIGSEMFLKRRARSLDWTFFKYEDELLLEPGEENDGSSSKRDVKSKEFFWWNFDTNTLEAATTLQSPALMEENDMFSTVTPTPSTIPPIYTSTHRLTSAILPTPQLTLNILSTRPATTTILPTPQSTSVILSTHRPTPDVLETPRPTSSAFPTYQPTTMRNPPQDIHKYRTNRVNLHNQETIDMMHNDWFKLFPAYHPTTRVPPHDIPKHRANRGNPTNQEMIDVMHSDWFYVFSMYQPTTMRGPPQDIPKHKTNRVNPAYQEMIDVIDMSDWFKADLPIGTNRLKTRSAPYAQEAESVGLPPMFVYLPLVQMVDPSAGTLQQKISPQLPMSLYFLSYKCSNLQYIRSHE
ncbi:hypothetical protein Pmani_012345 [Petrolisthes manimaculis]|uniref:Uncharacterized protein n=1 Tax=Petrolisthes manimaculis TaxID=1843537 RepID=A0AAE1UAC4_9EUCA|nr:hypothetical protein Pmani_012345 [Petrolisthes manimaculis]